MRERERRNAVSKHWGYNNVCMLLQTVLFGKTGDTADVPDNEDLE
jgi:hypothetical protein